MRVYLADLGHNQVTVSSDVYPLGIANLATYLLAHGGLDPEPDIRLFREPEALDAALAADIPVKARRESFTASSAALWVSPVPRAFSS